MIFAFKIFDIHEVQGFDENGMIVRPFDKVEWKRFDFCLDTREVGIAAFRGYVLFEDDTPINCTKVFLNDGSFVFACLNFDTFKKKYEEEYQAS